ncbi:hypothetical protein [uncultured Polaribacter sp.]|uniref:hypothetical protein n=1 Tax=uncultured Polaribacter sp. TaxID=174711 RepID=UPI00263137F3|nr:hypothetical protein [uncultured Polaribacter sp.]
MKNKLILFILFTCVFSTSNAFAQLDKNNGASNKGKIKAVILNNAKPVEKPKSIELKGNNGFKQAYDNEQKKLKKKQEEEKRLNKELLTTELLRKIKFQKFIEKNTFQIPMIDKDIGVFRTNSRNINLLSFDFGRIDGDKITILKNGKPIKENIILKDYYKTKSITIPLDIGFNKIEIKATDEGSYRPNTGAFTLFDDYKKEVFSDLWELAKGAKVIAHIIREKD